VTSPKENPTLKSNNFFYSNLEDLPHL